MMGTDGGGDRTNRADGIRPDPAAPARRSRPSRGPAVASLPFLPPAAQWVEAPSHPAIVDTTRAKRDPGWIPRFTALKALRDTLRPRADRP